jgi:hypothetical protein
MDMNVRQCSWEDVEAQLEQARDAEQQYFDRGKGPKGSLRRLFRRIGQKAPVLESIVEFIPEEKGLSLLKGSLAFLFKVILARFSPYRYSRFHHADDKALPQLLS